MRNKPSHPYPHNDGLMTNAERLSKRFERRGWISLAMSNYINRKFRFLAIHNEWRG